MNWCLESKATNIVDTWWEINNSTIKVPTSDMEKRKIYIHSKEHNQQILSETHFMVRILVMICLLYKQMECISFSKKNINIYVFIEIHHSCHIESFARKVIRVTIGLHFYSKQYV